MSRLPTEASFLANVAEHEMAVFHDDGVYRHLRFRKPDRSYYWFDVVTWPGYLSYTGDCGCFVFRRLPDMLEFFRDDRTDQPDLFINPGYWAEKVEGVDRGSGLKEYREELFRGRIAECLDEMEASPSLRKAVRGEVLAYADEGEHEAIRAAMEFEYEGRRPFSDFYEFSLKDFTFRFMWCCYALAWAVKQYDAHVAAKGIPVAEGA